MTKKIIYINSIVIAIFCIIFFFIKKQTEDIKLVLLDTNNMINKKQQELNLLYAELTYLKSPQYLSNLSKKYLNLKPTITSQIIQNQPIRISLNKKTNNDIQ